MSYRNSTFAAFPDTSSTGFSSLPVNRIALDLSTGAFYRKLAVGTADTIAAAVTAGNCVKTTVTEVSTEIAAKADKAYVDSALAAKADVTAMNNALAAKADKTTVDNSLAAKADVTAMNNALAAKADVTAMNTLLSAKLSVSGKAADSSKWDGSTKYVSVSDPSGGVSGDLWLQYAV